MEATRQQQQQQNRSFFKVPEFAEMLGVSERVVWQLIRTKQIPTVRPGDLRIVRITYDDAMACIKRWKV